MQKNEQDEVAENQEVKVVENATKTKTIDIYYNTTLIKHSEIKMADKIKIRAYRFTNYITKYKQTSHKHSQSWQKIVCKTEQLIVILIL